METTTEKGRKGEEIAAEHLEQKGYRIAAKNWRAGRGEIDLIAWWKEKCLVFVEVKTRGSVAWGKPEEFVGKKKGGNFGPNRRGILPSNRLGRANPIRYCVHFDERRGRQKHRTF